MSQYEEFSCPSCQYSLYTPGWSCQRCGYSDSQGVTDEVLRKSAPYQRKAVATPERLKAAGPASTTGSLGKDQIERFRLLRAGRKAPPPNKRSIPLTEEDEFRKENREIFEARRGDPKYWAGNQPRNEKRDSGPARFSVFGLQRVLSKGDTRNRRRRRPPTRRKAPLKGEQFVKINAHRLLAGDVNQELRAPVESLLRSYSEQISRGQLSASIETRERLAGKLNELPKTMLNEGIEGERITQVFLARYLQEWVEVVVL